MLNSEGAGELEGAIWPVGGLRGVRLSWDEGAMEYRRKHDRHEPRPWFNLFIRLGGWASLLFGVVGIPDPETFVQIPWDSSCQPRLLG